MNDFAALIGGKKAGFAYSATVIIYILIAFVVQYVAGMFLSVGDAAYRVICSLCSPIAVGIVVVFFSVKEKKNLFEIARFSKFDPWYFLPAVLLSAGMLFGLGFLNDAVAGLLRKAGLKVNAVAVSFNGLGDFAAFVLTLAVMPAVFEEVLFRGVIIGGLDKVKTHITVLFSAVSFALYHGSLAQFFYQFFYGAGLAWLSVRAGSALPSAIAHFINNLVVLSIEYFKLRVDFYNGVVIAAGCVFLACFAIFLIFYKNKGKKSDYSESKSHILGFLAYSAFGIAIAVTLIVSNLLI